MKTVIGLVVVTVLCLVGSGYAQQDLIGHRVRLQKMNQSKRLIGDVIRMDGQEITIKNGIAPEVSVPVRSLARIDVLVRKRRGVFRNAGIGIASGAVVGAGVFAACESGDKYCAEGAAYLTVGMSAVGGIVGLIYGRTDGDVWEQTRLPGTRYSMFVSPGGLTVAGRF